MPLANKIVFLKLYHKIKGMASLNHFKVSGQPGLKMGQFLSTRPDIIGNKLSRAPKRITR